MNFDLESRTILKVIHGSQCYGLATPESDIDFKGVAIEPLNHHFGFLHHFENHVEEASKGAPHDLVIYSLKKFSKLAADGNPSIIEVLFVENSDIVKIDSFGEELRAFRQNFVSKKMHHTFSGFAHSQLKRIKSHRGWLLNPPKKKPVRSDFGLSEGVGISKSELGAYEALSKSGRMIDLSKEAQVIFTREQAYKTKLREWSQYQEWLRKRNPKRAELEAKFGYDTKHASHVFRLMRMCGEILETGNVNVKRYHDREELLSIKQGALSYDELISVAESLENQSQEAYETLNVIPHSPDLKKIDEFVVDLTRRFIKF